MYNRDTVDREAEREGIAIGKMTIVRRENNTALMNVFGKQNNDVHRGGRRKMTIATGFSHTQQGQEAQWKEVMRRIRKMHIGDPLYDFPD